MLQIARTVVTYRELLGIMAWKQIIVRYKQSYLGLVWAILKPMTLMLVFTLLNGFISINNSAVPYPVLAFTALLPWIFYQESISEGVNSVVSSAPLIRKIYLPREVFPLAGVVTKLVEFVINAVILACLMIYFGVMPASTIVWVPLLLLYTVMASLAVAFIGAAANVFYRDVGAMLPIVLQLMMYASPVIYPMSLVKQKLLEQHAAGSWSQLVYDVYRMNPLAGIVDGFQRTVLFDQAPDFDVIWPGLIVVLILLPISFAIFKRAEQYFADVV